MNNPTKELTSIQVHQVINGFIVNTDFSCVTSSAAKQYVYNKIDDLQADLPMLLKVKPQAPRQAIWQSNPPGQLLTPRQKLFNHMMDNYEMTLLESEIDEIFSICLASQDSKREPAVPGKPHPSQVAAVEPNHA